MANPARSCQRCGRTIFGGNRSGYCSLCSRKYKEYRRGCRRCANLPLSVGDYFAWRDAPARLCANPHCRRELSRQNQGEYCYPCNKLYAGFVRDRKLRGKAILGREQYLEQRARGSRPVPAAEIPPERLNPSEQLPLVKKIVRTIRHPGLRRWEFDDLVSIGWLGLMEAAARYREDSGVPFPGFAAIRIRGAILTFLQRTERTSFIEPIGLDEELELSKYGVWTAAEQGNPERELLRQERIRRVRQAVERLDGSRILIRMRFWEEQSVSQIARALSRSEHYVEAHLRAAYEQLRRDLADLAPQGGSVAPAL